MSASTIVVHVAAVCSDSTIARPIDWRMRDSGPLPARPPARARANRGARFFGATGSSGLYGDSMCIGGSCAAPFSR